MCLICLTCLYIAEWNLWNIRWYFVVRVERNHLCLLVQCVWIPKYFRIPQKTSFVVNTPAARHITFYFNCTHLMNNRIITMTHLFYHATKKWKCFSNGSFLYFWKKNELVGYYQHLLLSVCFVSGSVMDFKSLFSMPCILPNSYFIVYLA